MVMETARIQPEILTVNSGGEAAMDGSGCAGWSDAVEDLVDSGDIAAAISVLESVVSSLSTQDPPPHPGDLRLATALGDLADLHSSRGFSLKAYELRSRALVLRARALSPSPSSTSGDPVASKLKATEREEAGVATPSDGDDEDDWEVIADRGLADEVLLASRNEAEAVHSTLDGDKEPGVPRRRGRGSFLYKKSCLYSDQLDVGSFNGDGLESEEEVEKRVENGAAGAKNSRYGTGHVLVLNDFPSSTRTVELEKLFDSFRDRGVAIRWVNDTVALAVFRTPSLAQEAQKSVHCPFKIRILVEGDLLLNIVSAEDLEPPCPRPKTSARTAQRLIAQGMGLKLSTNFGSNELRKQEEARKNRITARQIMKDEAWGSEK